MTQTTTETLHLVLKKKWYDMIASGEKKDKIMEANDKTMKQRFLEDFVKLCKKYHIAKYRRIENRLEKTSDFAYYLSYLEDDKGERIYANDMIVALTKSEYE